jgi:branched-subunit amino acid transport protein AzlD
MSVEKLTLTIIVIVLITFFTRVFPFLFFRKNQPIPPYILYIGRYLPPAIITIILVYSFKSVTIAAFPHGLPELIAAAFIIAIHAWKRNFLISILGGTLLYMLMVQRIFIG